MSLWSNKRLGVDKSFNKSQDWVEVYRPCRYGLNLQYKPVKLAASQSFAHVQHTSVCNTCELSRWSSCVPSDVPFTPRDQHYLEVGRDRVRAESEFSNLFLGTEMGSNFRCCRDCQASASGAQAKASLCCQSLKRNPPPKYTQYCIKHWSAKIV